MPIAMTDGTTYENSLDMLFAKDMPSREETDKQQRDKRMKEIDETMPPDMRGPPPTLFTPNEQDYYQHQEQFPKDQNDPSAWGMDEAIGRKGPAMVPLPDPKFHEVMDHMDYLINPEGFQKAQATGEHGSDLEYKTPTPPSKSGEITDNWNEIREWNGKLIDPWTLSPQDLKQFLQDKIAPKEKHPRRPESSDPIEDDTLPPNARPTSAELPEEKSAYQNFTDKLEELSKSLNPSFIPTAEQFRNAPWKEKLGFIIASSFMFAGPGKGPKGMLGKSDPLASWTEGLAEFDKANPPIIKTLEAAEKEGSKTAANLLGEYRKIDDPVVRAEFSKIVKDKIASASEGGETAPSDITNPTIRGMKEGSDWSEVITKPDGTKETVYDTAKIERLRNLRDNGLTFTEIGEKMGVSRNSVNSMLRRLKKMDAEEVTPSEQKPNSPWTPAQDKVLSTWYNDPNSDLVEPPGLLSHRSQGSIDARIKHLGLEKTAEEASSQPFVPKGAVSAPEKGSGSGPVNTELTGKLGVSQPASRRPIPDNQNITPENYGQNTVRRIISEHMDMMRNRDNPSGLTSQDITDIAKKHGPNFEEFQGLNPEANSASVFGRFLDRQMAVEKELKMLDRARLDPYDRAVLDRQNRKENIKPVKD